MIEYVANSDYVTGGGDIVLVTSVYYDNLFDLVGQ